MVFSIFFFKNERLGFTNSVIPKVDSHCGKTTNEVGFNQTKHLDLILTFGILHLDLGFENIGSKRNTVACRSPSNVSIGCIAVNQCYFMFKFDDKPILLAESFMQVENPNLSSLYLVLNSIAS